MPSDKTDVQAFRGPNELIRLIEIEANARGISKSEVIRNRLMDSYGLESINELTDWPDEAIKRVREKNLNSLNRVLGDLRNVLDRIGEDLSDASEDAQSPDGSADLRSTTNA